MSEFFSPLLVFVKTTRCSASVYPTQEFVQICGISVVVVLVAPVFIFSPVILSDFKSKSSTNFCENPRQISRNSARLEPRCSTRTVEQTGVTRVTVASCFDGAQNSARTLLDLSNQQFPVKVYILHSLLDFSFSLFGYLLINMATSDTQKCLAVLSLEAEAMEKLNNMPDYN